ncbi:3-dehydro-L-gulonate 2-dehydrogenase [uncultured Sunxiuqinia sp.]|uniref:3-dehydro-L-gulonate 2-dehydrogenase n=1 Tax=uncultured Sunxiuqinia sp. TaxID=1573825 RepID=UPI00260D2B69|nr:3-dehydro-L-gulonate 2-dehydrogenase [uncultured Sunxiuqinia sp.]
MSSEQFTRIAFETMQARFLEVLLNLGFPEQKAANCASIFANNSLDGIYSHGVNRFPRFVEYTRKGYIKPEMEAKCKNRLGAIEQWDGQLGPGPSNALQATERAMELAQEQGLGLVALANTNHWMRGGYYGWQAARQGFAFMGWANTIANLPAWGARECKLGNNPLVFALPYQDEAIVLDMAMSQFSYGKLENMQQLGHQLSVPGGFNRNNELSTQPQEIIETGRPLPIGYWKGAGLSLMLDLFASILSAGLSTSALTQQHQEEYGVSQVFIAINLKQLSNFPAIQQSLQAVLDDFHSAEKVAPEMTLRYPGQRVIQTRAENRRLGIPVHADVWQQILDF